MSRARELAKVGGKNQQIIAGLSSHVGVSTFKDNVFMYSNLEVTGTTAFNGGTLTLGDGASDNVVFGADVNSNIIPNTDNAYDLGSSSQEWKDLYVDGTANVDSLVADTADINGGTADNVVIGGSTAAAGSFTTVAASSNATITGNLDVDGATTLDGLTVAEGATFSTTLGVTGTTTLAGQLDANGDVNLGNATSDTITATGRFDSDLLPSTDGARDLGSSTLEWQDLYIDGTANIDSLVADTADINGGTADNVVIGGSTAAAGSFTTVAASSNATITGNLDVDGDTTLDTTDIAGTLTVAGQANVDNVIINGSTITTSADNLTLDSDGSSGGTVAIADNATVAGNLTVTGTTTLSTALANSNLANSAVTVTAGDGLTGGGSISLGGSATLNVQVDDSSIETDSDTLRVKASGVTNAMLAGSIANGKLSNSSVSYGGVSLSLGGSDGTPAFNLADATGLPISSGVSGLAANVATFLGTPSSANLRSALTDETGTGAAVFAASPTLTGTVVAANLDISGDVDIDGTTDLDNTNIVGTLNITGFTNIDNVTVNASTVSTSSGDLILNSTGGTVQVYDNLAVQSGLDVDGATTLDGLTVAENATFSAAIDVDGHTNLDNVSVAGVSTFAGATTFTGAIDANGGATVDNIQIGITNDNEIDTSSGNLVIDSAGGTTTVDDNLTVSGNLTVNGTTTTINSTTVAIDDKNFQVATGAADDAAADGAGLTVDSGDGDKTWNFEATGDNWGASENINIASGKSYKINNSSVLNATTLGSSVVASSLTSVGTIATGVWNGTAIANGYLANSSVSYGGVSLSLGGSDGTPAFDLSDATNYPTSSLSGTITNAQLAGSIAASKLAGSIGNAKLSNSSVSYGGVSLSLGGSDATPAFDLSDATNYPTSSLSGTITNAQLAGSIAASKLAGSIGDSKLSTISTANKVSLSALNIDGGTDIGAALANTDEIIVDDGGGGTNRRCDMSRVKTYIYGAMSGDATAGSGGAVTLAASGVSAGSYGSATAIPAITVDAKGRITSLSTNTVNTTTNLGKSTATGQITITSSTGDNVVIGEATSSIAGLMSTAHHDKLDGIAASATNVTNNNQITNGAGYITSAGSCASATNADTVDNLHASSFIRSDAGDTFSGDLTSSGGARLLLQKTDNNVSDHIIFYNGTTRIGEIGCEDGTWLRINQETSSNIYTPRYIRADAGFFVDGTSKGINGSGNFIGGTIAGASDYGTLLRSNTSDTMSGTLTMAGNILPDANGTRNLGASGTRWANVYSSDLDLSNEAKGGNQVDGSWGSYLIEEGENDLFLKNRRTGKQYKFVLQEV